MTDSCCRALRGAITVEENTADEILKATSQLLLEMVQKNAVSIDDMVSIFLTMTPDLNATFGAGSGSLGWSQVPFVQQRIAVPADCLAVSGADHINSEKNSRN